MSHRLQIQPLRGRHQCRRQPGDTGMTLVEVVVAVGLFLILMIAAMGILLTSLRTTQVNRNRVAAANLAGRELEILRGQFDGATRGPATVNINQVINENPLTGAAGSPVVLDNVRYTVTRKAQWFSVGATAPSACDNGTSSELAYLLVNVKVSWDRMSGKPISMDTILTPPKGTYSTSTGHIGVRLVDAMGKGVAGRKVTINGPAGNLYDWSADDGCTVFPFLTPGSYSVTVDESPYVNRSGTQRATLTAVVQSGQMWHGSIDYDKAATIRTHFVTLSGYDTPYDKDIPLTFSNSGLLPAMSMKRTGTVDPRDVADLWPFSSGYQIWAGTCRDADPLFILQTRAAPVKALPGGLTAGDVALAPLSLSGPTGTIVYATHAVDSSCTAGATIRLGTIAADGKLATSAPYGVWSLRFTPTGVEKTTVTLVRGDQPVTAVLS